MYPWQFQRKTATGAVKVGMGQLLGFNVVTGNPTVTLYDGLDATGTLAVNGRVCTAGDNVPAGWVFQKGLWVVMAGAGDITFTYR